jgi:hypothetical protein
MGTDVSSVRVCVYFNTKIILFHLLSFLIKLFFFPDEIIIPHTKYILNVFLLLLFFFFFKKITDIIMNAEYNVSSRHNLSLVFSYFGRKRERKCFVHLITLGT